MSFLELFTVCLNILFCIPSLASITKFDYWWIRGFDFPRIQISVLILVNILLALLVYEFDMIWQVVLVFALVLSLLYQLKLIYPYTLFAQKQVIKYQGKDNDDNLSILVSNVLMTNRDYDKLINLTRSRNPDILLTLESDKKWEEALSVLEEKYRCSVKVPKDNLFGMHLYSKLPLENMEVKYLVADDISSIHGTLKLSNGKGNPSLLTSQTAKS